jgi:hypothetical protein
VVTVQVPFVLLLVKYVADEGVTIDTDEEQDGKLLCATDVK